MKFPAIVFAAFLAACAPLTSTPPAEAPAGTPAESAATSPVGGVHFAAERVSPEVIRLSLDNGASQSIGYNLCSSSLERRTGSTWSNVPTGEVCTMQQLTLNPGADATFQKDLPANLGAGEYRYVTSIESPIGTAPKRVATAPFSR